MPSLPDLQAAFARAVIDHDEDAAADWIAAAHGLDAPARIAIYRNNVFGNYRNTLREVYPVIHALVGEPFFNRAADAYASRYPSRSGDLNDFGGELGEFLAQWPPSAQLVYLPDVAKLEWAMESVFHAADAAPLDLQALAAVPPEVFATLRFDLHPASRIVCSPYPILRIWQVNQPGFTADQSVRLDAGEDALLVVRRSSGVQLERLSPGELELLQCLAAGVFIADAHTRALQADPELDLSAFLQHHVLGGTLVAFDTATQGGAKQ
jgi:hypothetical protein